jgi:hypothetical protein
MTILQKTGGQEESTSFQRPSRSAHSYTVLRSWRHIINQKEKIEMNLHFRIYFH